MIEESSSSEAMKSQSETQRISREQALNLWNNAELTDLGGLANSVRCRIHPEGVTSYLIDRNINYTNVCNTDCSFCAFYRPNSKDKEAYVHSKEVIGSKVEEALNLGATRILLQGGHNDDLPYEYYLDLIAWIKSQYSIELNAFSPSEIHQMHLISKKPYETILSELKDAGLEGLPGGGAEILDNEIRKRVSPKKISADLWIDIMKIAQSLDLTTTATMVIGFGEGIEHRLSHLDRIRALQDESLKNGHRGFSAFIVWSLQLNENTSMGRSRHREQFGASSLEYLRMVALSRLYIDNIDNLQASWPTLGTDIARIALHFGCNDFGSTMMEENVVSQAGGATQALSGLTPEELQYHIRLAGFIPAQRNSRFEILKVFEKAA